MWSFEIYWNDSGGKYPVGRGVEGFRLPSGVNNYPRCLHISNVTFAHFG